MKRSRVPLFALAIVLALSFPSASLASNSNSCPITKAPDQPFVQPSPYRPYTGTNDHFLFGTPELWAFIETRWVLHLNSGNKLPYFSRDLDVEAAADPRLAVVARRLDSTQPLVWADWVNSAGPPYFANGKKVEGATDPGFMVTCGYRTPDVGRSPPTTFHREATSTHLLTRFGLSRK
jgi:hypothetical protein